MFNIILLIIVSIIIIVIIGFVIKQIGYSKESVIANGFLYVLARIFCAPVILLFFKKEPNHSSYYATEPDWICPKCNTTNSGLFKGCECGYKKVTEEHKKKKTTQYNHRYY